jgi:hypothetical protein
MRKQVDKLVVAVSLCLLAASWLLVPEKTAKAADAPPGGYGATCLTIVDDQWCKRTGTTACDYAWAQQGYCSGPCESCNDDTIISNSVCVVTYQGTCTFDPGGGSVTCSPTAQRLVGQCTLQNGSTCSCMNATAQGQCGAGYTYYRCTP